MTKFGLKLEQAKERRWRSQYVDYDRLKHVLQLAAKARDASPPPRRPCGLRNFDDDAHGLVASRHTRTMAVERADEDAGETLLSPAVLRAGLGAKERATLLDIRRCSRPSVASALRRAPTFNTLHQLVQAGDNPDAARHWTRCLFGAHSYPVLIHGFDVALTAELEKVEALYAAEIRTLETRWRDLRDDHVRAIDKSQTARRDDDLDDDDGDDDDKSSAADDERDDRDTRAAASSSLKEETTSSGRRRLSHRVGASPSASRSRGRTKKQVRHSPKGYLTLDEGTKKRKHPPSEVDEEEQRQEPSAAEKESLKRAMARLDYDVTHLADFCRWNYSALVKITKKRDKTVPDEPPIRETFCDAVRSHTELCSLRKAVALTDELRATFAAIYCDGEEGDADLRLQAMQEDITKDAYGLDPDAVRFGYRAGVAAVLAVWVLWDCVEVVDSVHNHTRHESVASKPAWPIFRACGELVAWHWMWGASLHVWSLYRVNVDFLFDNESTTSSKGKGTTHDSPSAYDVYDEAAFETIVLLASLLVYYKATYRGGLPRIFLASTSVAPQTLAAAIPVFVVLVALWRLVAPWSRRKHMWRSVIRVASAPCCEVRFLDTYVADVLSSMAKVYLDVLWSVCFFASGDFYTKEEGLLLSDPLSSSSSSSSGWDDGNSAESATPVSHDKRRAQPGAACTSSEVYARVVVPVVLLLPLWFRLMQCLRKYTDGGRAAVHLGNAAKYALSLFVALSSALNTNKRRRSWLALFCLSSLFSWGWDVLVDWGLRPQTACLSCLFGFVNGGRRRRLFVVAKESSGSSPDADDDDDAASASAVVPETTMATSTTPLRPNRTASFGERARRRSPTATPAGASPKALLLFGGRPGSRHMYPWRPGYWLAVAGDLALRFVWLSTLIPPNAFAVRLDALVPGWIVPMLALLELARRCVWGFLRLENEHVSNAFQHRPEQQDVPSHFRRPPKTPAPPTQRRIQGAFEAFAIVALVLLLLVRISISTKRDALIEAAHDRGALHDDDLLQPPGGGAAQDSLRQRALTGAPSVAPPLADMFWGRDM